ncbi:DUF397 domain-containing protein [Streptomyces griseoloalbus]|uniref:DUF397 domain-containing protein n=1 Tax=Streptomyces griseoloalbus TaxID=67303 RepID=UPI0033B77332
MAVRDSKVGDGPAVVFSVAGWASFIAALKERPFHPKSVNTPTLTVQTSLI